MKILNLLSSGGVGGIEQLCSNIAKYAEYDNVFCFLFQDGIIYDEMKNKGYDVISLSDCSENKFSKNRWLKLCNIAETADIIVTHHCAIALHSYYVALRKKYRQKKFVMTIHSCFEAKYNYSYDSFVKNKCAELTIKLALKTSDKVIFVSEAGRKSYTDNFKINNSKTAVVYNGVELPDYNVNVINANSRDFTRITYIGRIEKIKGLDLLIDAAEKLKNENCSFKVWVIGDGNYKDKLEEKVRELGLENEIEFTGTKRNIVDYLKYTDVFVYPSECQEVFGISIVEAMSYGIPCISNNVGGIPEIIKHGYNGFITARTNAEELFKCIIDFMTLNEHDKQIIRRNCVETAQKFSIQHTICSLEKELKGLINRD